MGGTMNRFILKLGLATLCATTLYGQEPRVVDKKGQASTVKFESVISGHLAELNGKYKLRATETTYEPGGYIGEHHHAGPGIRFVSSGQLTYVQPNKTTVYNAGDYFFESGDISHTAYNRTNKPVVVLNFEILPADWMGSSAMPSPK
jgi:quercetin dioxygenase-like cupin family protein